MRKKQYNYYRELLSFDDDDVGGKTLGRLALGTLSDSFKKPK
ncbi:hypothetical protein QM129_28425 [Klebsiella pneumoniae]|nr:hypothetical protein [Klebsiella pneumoniae]MDV5678119.1 hypothetical protein [Klebsiella pneumoniae]